MTSALYRQLKIAIINSTLNEPYHSYGDHWVDGFTDAGCLVDVFRYEKIPILPLKYDLYFFVEVRYKPEEIPWYIHPRVLYSWDSHIVGPDCYKAISEHFDKIFLASKIDTDFLNKAGIENIEWVPEACNPKIHMDKDLLRIYDIGIVGRHNETHIRNECSKTDFINFLVNSKYKNFFKTEIWGRPYVDLMNHTLLAFDRTISYNIGTRVFESAAMGCVPLWSESGITNANGMSLLMKPWIHYAPYMDTIKSLEETVDYLLSNPNKIKEIKNNAKTHVLEHHTYKNRVMGVLKRMNILYYKEDK
jgi:hypothetical protein